MIAIPNRKWFVERLRKENKGRFPSNQAVDKYMKVYQEWAEDLDDKQTDECIKAGYGT